MHPQLRAWAQLIRVPNTLTACADVLAGFTLVAGSWYQLAGIAPSLVGISIASICLYWAGMVLNDVNDVEADRAQRRNGPLVHGHIPVPTARGVGWALVVAGIGLAILSAYLLPLPNPDSMLGSDGRAPLWAVGAMATLLAIAIVAYDSSLKAMAIGPWLMGLCRALNLLLGVTLGACATWPVEWDWPSIGLATAGHGLFVSGITLAARREGLLEQSTYRLLASWMVSILGVSLIAICSCWSLHRELRLDPFTFYPLLVVLLGLPWLRRAIVSIHEPGVKSLVPAIKQAILTIIFFDAAVALQFGGNLPGILVCALAIPTLALSRVFRVT